MNSSLCRSAGAVDSMSQVSYQISNEEGKKRRTTASPGERVGRRKERQNAAEKEKKTIEGLLARQGRLKHRRRPGRGSC